MFNLFKNKRNQSVFRFMYVLQIWRGKLTQISVGIRPVWSVFTVHMKKAWILSYPLSAQQRLWSDWADAQADRSLCWAHMPLCWFCHEVAHIRQNRWTMEYRSLTCIYFMRSIFVSHWSISPNMMFIHQISFKILNKITDTKYRSLTNIYFMRSTFVSQWSIISSTCMTFIHQIVFKIQCKITGPRNIGHRPTSV